MNNDNLKTATNQKSKLMLRQGKIARLPRPLRNELNRRLADNEDGGVLLNWLNAAPAAAATQYPADKNIPPAWPATVHR